VQIDPGYSYSGGTVLLSNEPNQVPSEPVLGSFTSASNWNVLPYGIGTLSLAGAFGSSTERLGFDVWFSGDPSDNVAVDLFEYNGSSYVATQYASWNGTSWDISDTSPVGLAVPDSPVPDDPPPDPAPEPVTLVIWGVLGAAGATALRCHKQPKGRWSEESRQAIFQLIERNC
jgi:hypothetical protein